MRLLIRRRIEKALNTPVQPKKVVQACTNCGGSGHNKLTCPIPEDAEKPDIPVTTMRKPAARSKDMDRTLTPELREQARKEAKLAHERAMYG